MICPRCDVDLSEVRLRDVVIDQCGECGGIWFDFAAFERILNREARAARKLLPETERRESKDVETLPCPRCEDKLIRMRGDLDRMIYYTCLTCYGRWLDGDELKRIMDRPLAAKFEKLFQELFD